MNQDTQKKLIKAIATDHEIQKTRPAFCKQLGDYLVDELTKSDNIVRAKELFEKEKLQAKSEYEAAIKKSQTRWNLIKAECKHYVSKYYGDPSGNNDSCTICLICGDEI